MLGLYTKFVESEENTHLIQALETLIAILASDTQTPLRKQQRVYLNNLLGCIRTSEGCDMIGANHGVTAIKLFASRYPNSESQLTAFADALKKVFRSNRDSLQ